MAPGRGFQRFYGFLGGDTSQWYPELVYDNHQVEPPRTPEQGYHLSEDLVDKSIQFIADAEQVDPAKPFYLHLCFGATHAPHHVGKEWADRYAGQFDDGWDAYREFVFKRQKELGIAPADAELSRHDPDVQEWDSLSPDAKRLFSRMMEVFAGFLSHTDHQLGRLLDFLRTLGKLDNTLIMVISDNGASAEGGPTGTTNEAQFFNNAPESLESLDQGHRRARRPEALQPLPVGLDLGREHAVSPVEARDLPRRCERPVHRQLAPGARRRVGRRPRSILCTLSIWSRRCWICSTSRPRGTIRGVTQTPFDGVSFADTLADAAAASPRRTQYFEMLGHRAIYHDGWRAVCPWPGPSFAEDGCGIRPTDLCRSAVGAGREQLGALSHRRRLRGELQRRGRPPGPPDRADRHVVRGGRQVRRLADRRQWARPDGGRKTAGRAPADQLSGFTRIPSPSRSSPDPEVLNRPHSITAEVDIPDSGAEGVLLSQGSAAGGYALYVKNARLRYVHNYLGRGIHTRRLGSE